MGRPFSLELKMRVVALKDLTYSPDGIRIEAVAAGVEFDCPDVTAVDYYRSGLVEPAAHAGPASPEDTPKNTREPTPDQSEAIAAKAAEAAAADAAARDAAKIEAAEAEAAAKAAEADAAPKHPKAARKPKAE